MSSNDITIGGKPDPEKGILSKDENDRNSEHSIEEENTPYPESYFDTIFQIFNMAWMICFLPGTFTYLIFINPVYSGGMRIFAIIIDIIVIICWIIWTVQLFWRLFPVFITKLLVFAMFFFSAFIAVLFLVFCIF